MTTRTSSTSSPSVAGSATVGRRTVAWIIRGDERYGVRRGVENLSTGVREAGWSTPIICLTDGSFARECRDRGHDVHIARAPMPPSFSGGLLHKAAVAARYPALRRQICRGLLDIVVGLRPDALHFRWPNFVPFVGHVARRLRLPVFWEMPNCLGSHYPLQINRRLLQWWCRHCGIQPVANSAYTASTLGDHPVRPIVSYMGVDQTRFDPDTVTHITREELGLPPDAVVFGIFSRITPNKGQQRILQALIMLRDEIPSAHLLLLGGPTEGPEPDALRAAAAAAGAANRLHFGGVVDNPECYYAATDVAISSGLVPEAFGHSVVEAMTMGRPVLVHALGGPAETVIDGVTGWHVSDPSVGAFAAGLQRVIRDRPRWGQMGAAARRRALEHFTLDGQVRRYMNIVERRLASGARAGTER